jgi:hypothetical protein
MSDPHATNGHAAHSHEKSDASPGSVAGFEFALLLLCAVSMALMAGLFYYLTERETVADTSRSPLATERVVPPSPNLQISPTADLEQLRAEEETRLQTYGWVDQEQQIVRIPVEKAMDIVAERGVPATLPAATGQGQSQ